MTLLIRHPLLSTLAAGAGLAASLAAAGPAFARTVHAGAPVRTAPVPGAHLADGATPGQQIIPVALGTATYSVTPTSKLTLAEAIQDAPAGSVIHLASGTYPAIDDSKIRSGWVTVSGLGDATQPVIAGAHLYGSQYLRVVGVEFSTSVVMNVSYTVHKWNTENIALLDDTVDCGSDGSLEGSVRYGNTGILVRGASQNVTIEGDDITNCTSGIASVAQDKMSNNIAITHDTIWGVSGDDVDLGGLENVDIDDDVIGDAVHAGPESLWHDDAIQFYGNTNNVAITNNVLANSGGQLLFIQDAVKSDSTGSSVNSNVLVQNNLIYGSGAYAVQDQGGVNVSFIGNTIWDSHWGGLLIRKSSFTGIVPTQTTIVDNVLSGYGLQAVVPDNEHNNLIDGYLNPTVAAGLSPTDMIGATPTFANPSGGNFQLTGVTLAPSRANAVSASGSGATSTSTTAGNTGTSTTAGNTGASTTVGASSGTSTTASSTSTPTVTSTPVSSTPASITPPAGLGSSLVGSFGAPLYGPTS